jgi:hypothetical protein
MQSVKPLVGVGMEDTGLRQPPVEQSCQALPVELSDLSPATNGLSPESLQPLPKYA